MTRVPSFSHGWVTFRFVYVCVHHVFFTMDRGAGCFHIVAVVNNVAISVLIAKPLWLATPCCLWKSVLSHIKGRQWTRWGIHVFSVENHTRLKSNATKATVFLFFLFIFFPKHFLNDMPMPHAEMSQDYSQRQYFFKCASLLHSPTTTNFQQ